MNDNKQQQHKQQQQNMPMNFVANPGAARAAPVPSNSAGNNVYTQEQFEALRRHHVQAQAARAGSNDSANSAAPVAANSIQVQPPQNQSGRIMVLTQVAVPAQMLGQLTQQGLVNLNQLPPSVHQQIVQQQLLLQQSGQNQCQQPLQQQQPPQQGQMDANLMQQLIAGQMNKHNTNASNQNPTTGPTLPDLFSSLNEQASEKNANSDMSNTNKRLFLETQVQPVQRQLDSYSDDDLFKFFDMEMGEDASGVEDLLHPSTLLSSKKPNEMPTSNSQCQNVSSYLEPTPMFQQAASVPQQVHSQAAGPSSDYQQQHRQSRQPQHVPASVPSQPQEPRPVCVSSQSITPANSTFSLPSTMVPPTVLASVCPGNATKRPTSKKKTSASKRVKRSDTPQDVLMRLVEQQGHLELQRIKSEDAGYDTMPSPLQLSSFGTQVVQAVHTSDAEMLGKLLSCGLSPNPCNQFRDSILDLVCKRNNSAIFKCLLEHGSDIRVVDGFGRTPLHHCAWASSFTREIAEAILERDPLQLFIEDKRGQTPMEYARVDIMSEWSEFLEEMADKYWPKGGPVPKLTRPKDSRPDGTLPDPKNAVSASLASMISSGNITLEQFESMDEATRKKYG